MSNIGMLQHLQGRYDTHSHPNPMFNYVTGFVPRKIKDLFRWGEYLYYSSPHIWQAVNKLSDYVITDITYKTDSEKVRKQYEGAHKKLGTLSHVKAAARDRWIYGNFFGSIYFPRRRNLACANTSCGKVYRIDKIQQVDYHIEKCRFEHTCPACNDVTITSNDDVRTMEREIRNLSQANLIRWDPKYIDPEVNPVTGRKTIWHTIPASVKSRIEESDRSMIDDTPIEYLEACRENELFQFHEDHVFHMKIDAPAGVDEDGWGFPPLTAVIKQFFYTEILRRANEAIALDHLVPFRVLHPGQSNAAGNPIDKMDLARWVRETKKNLMHQRHDPLHIQFAPIPVGVTQVGGQGRSLLTLGEVEMAEDNILAGMGVPREFLHGGLSYTGSSVTLRILENQLLTHAKDLNEYLQWICDRIADYMRWERVEVELIPFKFVDDTQQTGALMQLDSAMGLMSKQSWADRFDIDYDEEQDKIAQEMIDDMRRQAETDSRIQELQQSLSQQAQQQAMQGVGLNYDQQAVIAEADQLVQQLMGMDDGLVQSNLAALQAEDYVMYSVVIQRYEQAQTSQEAQMRAQAGI